MSTWRCDFILSWLSCCVLSTHDISLMTGLTCSSDGATTDDIREGEVEGDAECTFDFSPRETHFHEHECVHIDDTSVWTDCEPCCLEDQAHTQIKALNVSEGELADVFFTESRVPKLAGDKKSHQQEVQLDFSLLRSSQNRNACLTSTHTGSCTQRAWWQIAALAYQSITEE